VAAIPETKYAMAGDAHIAYQVFGQGETDLVWMPHWATHLEMLWEDPLSRRPSSKGWPRSRG
jgi:hypothetical protein